MSRRVDRERKRLERIHHRRLREQAERIKECVERDACDHPNCRYFPLPDAAAELAEWVLEILDDEKSESACAFEGGPDGTRD